MGKRELMVTLEDAGEQLFHTNKGGIHCCRGGSLMGSRRACNC